MNRDANVKLRVQGDLSTYITGLNGPSAREPEQLEKESEVVWVTPSAPTLEALQNEVSELRKVNRALQAKIHERNPEAESLARVLREYDEILHQYQHATGRKESAKIKQLERLLTQVIATQTWLRILLEELLVNGFISVPDADAESMNR